MNHLFVDNLTVIDFAYLDASRGLVGESWIVDVVLGGELDDQGMVFDFSNVKRTIKRVIDERVDHRLVIPRAYKGLEWNEDEPDSFTWHLTDGTRILHRSPDEACSAICRCPAVGAGVTGSLAGKRDGCGYCVT